MSSRVLVIGYGSIGRRHAEILSEIDTVSRVYVLSSQNGLPYKTIASLKEIPGLTPDYIVIASPTDQHYSQLKFLNEHLESRKILVEKPLFDIYHDFTIKNNQVFVGYNLRFHPMINKIKNFCWAEVYTPLKAALYSFWSCT